MIVMHGAGVDAQGLWAAVAARDSGFDGRFVYAVRSTGVYCRPGCPSRRPRQSQAVFFDTSEEAREAGYRACRRCLPDELDADAGLARRVCEYIDGCLEAQDGLPRAPELSEAMGVGVARLRRVFRRETGLTPTQYARGRRLERFKSLLRDGAKVAPAMYDAGYGSASRLYENAAEQLGMTPASYRKGGAGAVIRYAVVGSALGALLVAGTGVGVCAVKLGDDPEVLVAELESEFPAATIINVGPGGVEPGEQGADSGDSGINVGPGGVEPGEQGADSGDSGGLLDWVGALLEYLDGRRADIGLPLDVQATVFQWRVWRKLQGIPLGETRTYRQLAEELEQPKASRAVGRACATNPVAPIVPCHRALRTDGGLAGYRWGLHRKESLLDLERRQSG